MEKFLFAAGFLLAILLFIFWLRQFFDLMARSDNAFPGKYDKPIWAAVLILTSILGAFIYLIFRLQEDSTETIEAQKPEIEHSQPCLKCGKTIPPDATKCPFCGWSYMDEK